MILRDWMNTTRYVYNKSLEDINNGHKVNFQSLRNKRVTRLNNPHVNDWEIKTPKDIRAGGIRDLVKAFKTSFSNLRNGNLTNFKISFRSKRQECSLEIPKSSFEFVKSERCFKLKMFKTYFKSDIKVSKDKVLKNISIEHDSRLQYSNGCWYIIVPIKVSLKNDKSEKVCSLDPGVRNFQTIYSEDYIIKSEIRKENLKKIQTQLDLMQSLRAKKIISKKHSKRRMKKIYNKLFNYIDDTHYKIIKTITSEFDNVYLPKFESQDMVQGKLARVTKRGMLTLKHYQFQQRLKSKIEEYPNKSLSICTEEYTSKTCTNCGNIKNNLGGNKLYKCSKCYVEVDRDVNGARNILIKNVLKL